MSEAGKTFSESWYRVAGLQLCLRPRVRVRRQFFRGEKWFVLQNPFDNQFYRVKPEAWAFVARLRPGKTVEDVWKECMDRDPDAAPGQEDVIRLLAQLYHGNLLQYDLPADSVKLFERYAQRRQREVTSRLLNIMFARFPLLDPDEFLQRWLPVVRWVLNPVGAIIWGVTLIMAVKILVEHGSELVDQSQGILAPHNLPLLYLAMIATKGLHEFGHAFLCRKYGGEVHTMGVMLLIFTPIPYVDATSAWAFRSRYQRIMVGAAGMIVELFVASCAAFVWAGTGDGVIHSLAYNVMFVASISTLLFNGNPLLRYDGYYILADLIEVPNLSMRSLMQLRHLIERYVFGCHQSTSQAANMKEAWWLVVYAIASGAYRLAVFTGIIFFVADRFLLAGLVMAVVCVVSWGVVPMARLAQYFTYNPRLERTRLRAAGITAGAVAALLLILNCVPAPNSFKAPGILQATHFREVTGEAPGVIAGVEAPTGRRVAAGQVLVVLENPELAMERALTEAQVAEADAALRRARSGATADVEPLAARLGAVRKRLEWVRAQVDALTIRAPMDGIWTAPGLDQLRGAWLQRGVRVGWVIQDKEFEFSAIVSQQQVSRLFAPQIRRAEIKLRGQSNRTLVASQLTAIPAEQRKLRSAALGWQGGGDVKTDLTVASGLQAAEPFFEVLSQVNATDDMVLCHGCSGRIRFTLPWEPLMHQWAVRFRQMLQRRYNL